MLIPRFNPTYTFQDLAWAWRICQTSDPADLLSRRLSQIYGTRHVFLFAAARVALYALLKAYDRPGEVVVPAYNCIAVPEAVLYAGSQPVFADIGDGSLNMTASTLKKAISRHTKAVLVTHQFGIPCDIDEIMSVCENRQVLVIEDAAAAIGAKFKGRLVGTFSNVAIISFQKTKVISGGIGGGAILTNDDDLASKITTLRRAARPSENRLVSFLKALTWKTCTNRWLYSGVKLGYQLLRSEEMFEIVNPRSEIPPGFLASCPRFSAALVLTQLASLDHNVSRRGRLAQMYIEGLSKNSRVELPEIREDRTPAWIQFPVRVGNKASFYQHMKRQGVDLSWTFRYSCADSFGAGRFPNSRQAARTILGLPTYPSLSDKQADYICRVAGEYQAFPAHDD